MVHIHKYLVEIDSLILYMYGTLDIDDIDDILMGVFKAEGCRIVQFHCQEKLGSTCKSDTVFFSKECKVSKIILTHDKSS